MASTWDIISSILFLGIFLGVVYFGIKFSSILSDSTTSAQTSLKSKGVTYEQGRLSLQTDLAAPSRQEYIANTQAAFERGGRIMKAHKDAFTFNKSQSQNQEENQPSPSTSTSTTGLDGDKRGFRRTKKLA
ncbi:uncharacterized protein IL334_005468 [Kwoniella shivajii]|uniref:Uncharacterized protein n=1 Tax=Kwoniella shivajii TaxID=564305 RepID=A0ABZ1D4I9_9TREE|nr:hypothetical protein IL334_005468 [Kwoniella shivajii]